VRLTELDPALRKLRLSGMADHLEMRIVEAQKSQWAPIDLVSALVQDELTRRQDRLLERRIKQARFRDAGKTLEGFDFAFNPKIDRALVFELATGRFLARGEDALFLGPPGPATYCSISLRG
jgi:DNA replication protein DnaC